MLADIRKIPQGDLVLLHGCCHNPTGWDPSIEQWERLAEAIEVRESYSIYVVGSGRINVAALTEQNIERVADAIVAVIGTS